MSDLLITRGLLLNFAHTPIVLPHPFSEFIHETCEYKNVEARYQAMKAWCIFDTWNWREVHDSIADKSLTPKQAKDLGRGIGDLDTELWDLMSFGVMLEAQRAKFFQNERPRTELLNTGTRRLVEHRPDRIWGDNMDGSGKNLCGTSLMLVRRMVVNEFSG